MRHYQVARVPEWKAQDCRERFPSAGWYYRPQLPDGFEDSIPRGPFNSRADAVAATHSEDARGGR